MNTAVGATQTPPDTQAPAAPATLTATAASTTQINLSWPAATDNVAVVGYRVERQAPGASTFTQIATPATTTFNDTGLTPGATYSYRVRAVDAAGNLGAYSPVASATTQADLTGPTVSVTAPANNASVTGTITITANASDNVGVVGVQFLLDGAILIGPEDTTSPYSVAWDTSTVAGGQHTLSAKARDAAGNFTISAIVTVNVTNANDPAVVGQWSSVMDFPLVAINMALMKNNKILMWSGQECIGGESATVYDPATNTFTPVPLAEPDGSDRDIFCSGMTVLADGRVLDAGGHECTNLNLPGNRHHHKFRSHEQPVDDPARHAVSPVVSQHHHDGGRPRDRHRRRRSGLHAHQLQQNSGSLQSANEHVDDAHQCGADDSELCVPVSNCPTAEF